MDGHAKGAGRGFEDRFDLMVRVGAMQEADMKVAAELLSERVPEMLDHLRREITNGGAFEWSVEVEVKAAGEVHDGARQGFIHRYVRMAVAGNVCFIAHGFSKRLPQRDTNVFDRVMVVYMQVAFATHRETEAPVLGEKVEHMIKKAHTSLILIRWLLIKGEADRDSRLAGLTVNLGGTGFEVWCWHGNIENRKESGNNISKLKLTQAEFGVKA